jgi:DNA polymerase-1
MGLLERAKKTLERNDDFISKLMLIDYSSILYKGLGVHTELTCRDTYTGGLVGLVDQFGSLIREHRPEHVIVCKDVQPYFRKTEVFPAYKEDRAKRKTVIPKEAFRDTLKLGSTFCELAGLHSWGVAGWEADDLFAFAVKKFHKRYDRIIIASADDDLYQLFDYDNVYLCKKKGLYGRRQFDQEFPDLTPQDWVIFNAIKGGHNNYKGIQGIGQVKALEIMRDDSLLDKTYSENEDLLNIGLQVCSLPLPKSSLPKGMDFPEVPEPFAPQYDELAIRDFLRQYGIRPSPNLRMALTHLSGFK